MGIISIDKLGRMRFGPAKMYTRYPQIALTSCITCEQEFFFRAQSPCSPVAAGRWKRKPLESCCFAGDFQNNGARWKL